MKPVCVCSFFRLTHFWGICQPGLQIVRCLLSCFSIIILKLQAAVATVLRPCQTTLLSASSLPPQKSIAFSLSSKNAAQSAVSSLTKNSNKLYLWCHGRFQMMRPSLKLTCKPQTRERYQGGESSSPYIVLLCRGSFSGGDDSAGLSSITTRVSKISSLVIVC